jgi:hypothetical protein
VGVEPPFAIVGPVPEAWAEDLYAFADALAEHAWGGRGLERLVVGDVDASLREWMPQADYDRWRATQSVRSVVTGGKSFVADDGRRTAVVSLLTDRLLFLHMPTHETVEAALDARQDAEGYEFVDGTHWGASHVLWTEYVVERTRCGIARSLGWDYSALDNGFVVESLRDFEQNLPAMVWWAVAKGADPMESHQHWFELVRVYAMGRGRADAGSPIDEQGFTAFFAETLGAELETEWRNLDAAFQAAYERPTASTQELDELVHDDGWRRLYDEYRSIWAYLVRAEKG